MHISFLKVNYVCARDVSGAQVQELSTAALGYHKVVKENQKLYNMVQDLKGWYFSHTKMLAFYGIFSQLSKFVI